MNADILWFVEHIDRELDTACIVKTLLEDRHNVKTVVRHYYAHAREALLECNPKVVVHPFFYFAHGALATEDYVARWPEAVHFNLAWEELFYGAMRTVKAPSDDFARTRVIHHAWGDFYREYLAEHGVPAGNVLVNGNPTLHLYKPPYRDGFKSRSALAKEYGLDPDAPWVFIPENYRWAFFPDRSIEALAQRGGDAGELAGLKAYCRQALAELLRWCEAAARRGGCEVVFRPRPATHTDVMSAFIRETFGETPFPVRLIKGESVREWILASDTVVSSYSTCLIEAAVAGKPSYMAEPLPMPPSLVCDWYALAPRLRSATDFLAVCSPGPAPGQSRELRAWAEGGMLAGGDPLEGLARIVAGLAGEATRSATGPLAARDKTYFNPHTHEKDLFDEADVQARVSHWRGVLGSGADSREVS